MKKSANNSKGFVLDTNILLSSGGTALYGFDDNIVYITGTTLQELDRKKEASGEVGYNARSVIRELDELRKEGNLLEGVPVGNGICRLITKLTPHLPEGYDLTNPDNRIISACLELAKSRPAESITLVTNDVSLRVNADLCFRNAGAEIGVEGYQNDQVKERGDYMGYRTDEAADPSLIDKLYTEETIELPDQYSDMNHLEFLIAKCGQQSAIAVRVGDTLKLVKESHSTFGIKKTYNAAQRMLLWALLAPVEEVPLVIAKGPAGTGKTLLALAAGLDGATEEEYNRVLIGRSNVSNRHEQEFGYLPGEIEQKMAPMIAPFRDNLEVLLRKDVGTKESNTQIQMQINDIMSTMVEVCPLVYIRGRSISHSYLIVDEAQNTNKMVIRDVISRAGIKSKVVLLGDSSQIDASTLDRWSCGLEVAWERMRGVAAEIQFSDDESVRSELAKAAIQMMR